MAILKESFFVLTCIGLWRPVEWQGIKGAFYNCYTLLVILNSVTFVISESMELIFFNDGIFDFFNNSSMLITIIGMCGKTITVISNRGTIIKMIEKFNGNPFSPRDNQEEIIHKNFNRMIRWFFLKIFIWNLLKCYILSVKWKITWKNFFFFIRNLFSGRF